MTSSLEVRSGKLCLTIKADLGGRFSQLTHDGVPLLSGPEVNPDNWGATFWTSPQSDWGWPPLAMVDSEPYTVKTTPREVLLRSGEVKLGAGTFVVEKHVMALTGGVIDVRYVIDNVGREALRIAAWEISRVLPGGLTFFPTGERELSPIEPHGRLELEKSEGSSFFDHGAFTVGHSTKVHADGREGWLAHLAGNRLLLKTFRDSTPDEQAPGEGEVEIFANLDGRYVEVEVQGPYVSIDKGASSSFVVRTQVAVVSDAVAQSRRELVKVARSLAAGMGIP